METHMFSVPVTSRGTVLFPREPVLTASGSRRCGSASHRHRCKLIFWNGGDVFPSSHPPRQRVRVSEPLAGEAPYLHLQVVTLGLKPMKVRGPHSLTLTPNRLFPLL